MSGSTRTAVVNLKGYFPGPGKVASTKKAVHPFGGCGTCATYTPGLSATRLLDLYALPIASTRKSRCIGIGGLPQGHGERGLASGHAYRAIGFKCPIEVRALATFNHRLIKRRDALVHAGSLQRVISIRFIEQMLFAGQIVEVEP